MSGAIYYTLVDYYLNRLFIRISSLFFYCELCIAARMDHPSCLQLTTEEYCPSDDDEQDEKNQDNTGRSKPKSVSNSCHEKDTSFFPIVYCMSAD